MQIKFNKDDEKTLFFNLISIYKQFGEIEELRDINPPISLLDFMIKKLAEIIYEYKFFETNFSTENLKEKIMFLLGTGNFNVDYLSDKKTIFPEIEPEYYFKIDIDKLWNYLKENGLEL